MIGWNTYNVFTRMGWPPCSTEMNYIERIQAELSRQLNPLQALPQKLQQFGQQMELKYWLESVNKVLIGFCYVCGQFIFKKKKNLL